MARRLMFFSAALVALGMPWLSSMAQPAGPGKAGGAATSTSTRTATRPTTTSVPAFTAEEVLKTVSDAGLRKRLEAFAKIRVLEDEMSKNKAANVKQIIDEVIRIKKTSSPVTPEEVLATIPDKIHSRWDDMQKWPAAEVLTCGNWLRPICNFAVWELSGKIVNAHEVSDKFETAVFDLEGEAAVGKSKVPFFVQRVTLVGKPAKDLKVGDRVHAIFLGMGATIGWPDGKVWLHIIPDCTPSGARSFKVVSK